VRGRSWRRGDVGAYRDRFLAVVDPSITRWNGVGKNIGENGDGEEERQKNGKHGASEYPSRKVDDVIPINLTLVESYPP